MQQIFDLIRKIHQKAFNKPLGITRAELTSVEKQMSFVNTLESMDIAHPTFIEFLKDQGSEEVVSRQLLTQSSCSIQVYILEMFSLASRDVGSHSDPYIVVRCGDKEFSERDSYQVDEPDPKINKFFQFNGNFPGSPDLEIEAWDYDSLFGDDLIGKTIVDLDDRFFSPDWQALEEKPIE